MKKHIAQSILEAVESTEQTAKTTRQQASDNNGKNVD